jgi:hypothetical protein
VLTGEQTNPSELRTALGPALGASTVDPVALLGTAFLVAVALAPAIDRRRWPSALLRGPPALSVR